MGPGSPPLDSLPCPAAATWRLLASACRGVFFALLVTVVGLPQTCPGQSTAISEAFVPIPPGGEALTPQGASSGRSRSATVHIPEYPKAIHVGAIAPAGTDAAAAAQRVSLQGTAVADARQREPSQPIPIEPTHVADPSHAALPYLPAGPEAYRLRCGVQCDPPDYRRGGPGWHAMRPIPWEVFAQGEYVGPARLAHVPVYRLRVDDVLSFVYRLSGKVAPQPYRLNVRDQLRVESLSAPQVVDREILIQPDGTITLRMLGQVRAAGSTIDELRQDLNQRYKRHIRDPEITVTPLVLNSTLEELRASVDRRFGSGGQARRARVTPSGSVQLPAIGSVPAQGLTLEELGREIEHRYAQIVDGLQVTPILVERAPRYVYVVGEVRTPGRFRLEGPTTVMQAIAMAGSWNVGAHLKNVVIFRRDENWQLIATKANVRSSLLFGRPCPSGEIWLRDSDVVLVPKSPILIADDLIELVFTRGVYGVVPMTVQMNFAKLSTL